MQRLTEAYLQHLNIRKQTPSLSYLCELQSKHIERIPHENINGIFNLHSSFDIPHLLHKFIKQNRGGMCFELNYAFAWLLISLGFKLELRLGEVRAYEHDKENNAYPTHACIIVHFKEFQVLADVGWSDSYRHPLQLNGEEHSDHTGRYRVILTKDNKLCMQKWLESTQAPLSAAWHDQFIVDRPKQPTALHFPNRFLAAHAYTHFGEGYLFTTLFHFTKSNSHGHTSIWSDKLLHKVDGQKSRENITTDIPSLLTNKFSVAPEIAAKCRKPTRSLSMLFSYSPKSEEVVLEIPQRRFHTI